MKYISIFTSILLYSNLLFGQTEKESEKIVGEIHSITEKYNRTWETLDMEQVAKFHSDSSFRYYRNMKSGIKNNEDFKNLMPKYMSVIKSWKMEVSTPVVQVLGDNAAIISFIGKAEMIDKDNKSSDAGSGAYTYVWSKFNGEWKIVHIHESTK